MCGIFACIHCSANESIDPALKVHTVQVVTTLNISTVVVHVLHIIKGHTPSMAFVVEVV